jgi:MFS family permease
MIFGFAAVCFLMSALALLFSIEPRDNYDAPSQGVGQLFRSAWSTLRTDADFRLLAFVAMGFGSSLMLFPHYQALGRSDRLSLSFDNLMFWVIIQNAGTALFSLVAGPIADRRGNRLVMQMVLIAVAAMPITAIGLSYWPAWGATLYPIVFLFVGLTPIGFKTMINYTLEMCGSEDHPRYLSTLGLCFAVPLLLSPVVGWMVEAISFELAFFLVGGTVFSGWLLSLRLREPRQALRSASPVFLVPEEDAT